MTTQTQTQKIIFVSVESYNREIQPLPSVKELSAKNKKYTMEWRKEQKENFYKIQKVLKNNYPDSMVTTKNTKMQGLESYLKKLIKLAQKDSKLAIEFLLESYNWMSPKQAKEILTKIEKITLGKNQLKSLSLPSGFTCSKAKICKAFANKYTGEVKDSKDMLIRCYAVSCEARSIMSRAMLWYNLEQVKNKNIEEIQKILNVTLRDIKILRLSTNGDIMTKNYYLALNAWCESNPEKVIFGYTKHIEYVHDKNRANNFYLVYSEGGVDDSKMSPCTPSVKMVFESQKDSTCEEWSQSGKSEDFFKILLSESYSLVVHGTQPKQQKAILESLKKSKQS